MEHFIFVCIQSNEESLYNLNGRYIVNCMFVKHANVDLNLLIKIKQHFECVCTHENSCKHA